MADTSTINYKCSIYPIREFSTDNFMYGYSVADSPLDSDGNYIPFNEQLFEKIVMSGLRPYRTFSDVGNSEISEAIQAIVSSGSTNVYVSDADIFNTFRANVSLVEQDRILQENYFDCDNPVFDDVPLTSTPSLKLGTTKKDKMYYFNTWSTFIGSGGNQYLEVELTDGTNTCTYQYKRKGHSLEWNNTWGDTSLVYGYDVESGVTVDAGSETNAFKEADKLIQNYLKKISYGMVGTDAEILGEKENIPFASSKNTFSFSTGFQAYDDLKQFQSLSMNNLYGVLIYQDGETVTQDKGYGISVADFSNCLFYGYCNIDEIDLKSNEIHWQGYYYQIPKAANFMHYAKETNRVTNSAFTSNITGWTASGGATATHDSSNGRLQIGGIGSTSDYVSGTGTAGAVFDGLQGLEFEVFDFTEHASSPTNVNCRVELSTGDSFDVQITGNGKYSFINESGNAGIGGPTIYFEGTNTGSGDTSFDVDNVIFWELE